mgnify:CR=1 FL=1
MHDLPMPAVSPGILLEALWTGGAAWVLALAFAARARASRLLDVPDARKQHAAPVPRVGGIAVAGALLAGALMLFAGGPLAWPWAPYLALAAGAFAIGLADDLGRLQTRDKLAWQVVLSGLAGAVLAWRGDGVGAFGAITFGWLSPLMTALWVFAVLTVVNFIDGIDGITACVVVVMLGIGFGCGAGPGNGTLYLLAAAAVCGTAFWNVTPARVFLGDSGTHLLGFLVATLPMTVRAAPEAVASVPWAYAAAPLMPCVLDVGWGIVSKIRHGVPIHAAHSDHVYQRITKAGTSHLGSAVRYGVLTVIGAALVRWSGDLGFEATVAVAAVVLLLHFGQAAVATRGVPHEFGGAEAPAGRP